jgi:hypothetical protein
VTRLQVFELLQQRAGLSGVLAFDRAILAVVLAMLGSALSGCSHRAEGRINALRPESWTVFG